MIATHQERLHRPVLVLIGLKPLAHLVDAHGQLAHVVSERCRDAIGEVPLPELLGRAPDDRHWAARDD